MSITETALRFTCGDAALYGILTAPPPGNQPPVRGVLIVVGGPQYRAGSHRQFTLLARSLAAGGLPVMRFDYRGMGDSEGEARPFDAVDDDLRAAIDRFFTEMPSLESVVIWGLCDGASAALFYSPGDARVSGLVLLNPWVRTDAGAARTQLKHYYRERLADREFWIKIVRGRFDFAAAARSLAGAVVRAVAGAPAKVQGHQHRHEHLQDRDLPLPERMRRSLEHFSGRVLVLISGRDLTAAEFLDTVAGAREWQALMAAPRVTRHDLAEADHTFSRRAWRDQVAAWTLNWLRSW